MFFKLHSFYRQLSQFSVRLVSKKLSASCFGNSGSLTNLSNSPLRIGHHMTSKNSRRDLFNGSVPSPFGILPIERRRTFFTSTRNAQEVKSNSTQKTIETHKIISSETENPFNDHKNNNLNLMFPLLTGEELKAFDSSVYE